MDTLDYSKQLIGAGFTVRQAEAQTKLLNEVFMSELATKNEISMSFKEMDTRFKAIDIRFQEMDNRFEAIDNHFKEIDNQFKEVHLKIDAGFARIDLQMMELRNEMKALPNMILGRLFKALGVAAAIIGAVLALRTPL